MKRTALMLIALVAISFTSCKNDKASNKVANNSNAATETTNNQNTSAVQQNDANKKYPKIKFDEPKYDFGTITEGDVVQHEFTFTNTGDAPLKIMGAHPSCGCTVPSYPKGETIAPGEKGSMMVKFNSRGKHGHQSKSVRLTTNTKKGSEVLRFTADVQKKDAKK